MNVNGIGSLATTLATTATGEETARIAADATKQLQGPPTSLPVTKPSSAWPSVSKPNLPEHLGGHIDTTA